MSSTPLTSASAVPVSPAQRGLWLINEMHPESSVYNVFCTVLLRGGLDVAAMRLAVRDVVRGHEMLRSVFPSEGGVPVRRVHDDVDVPVVVDDLSGAAPEDVERVALAWAEEPFDLAFGPLLRAGVLRLGPDEHLLCVAVHHIVCDGHSLRLIFDDLAAAYAGRELPPAVVGGSAAAPPAQDAVRWWRDYLAGAPDLLTVVPDRPRPSVRGVAGATHVAPLPADLVAGVAALARTRRMSPFMVLLAGFGALLGRLTGAPEVLVGIPTSTRGDVDGDREVGMFVDTAPVRLRTGAESFTELLARVRESVLGVLSHPGVPFDRLVTETRPNRAPSHTPLVQVAFSADLAPYAAPAFPGLRAEVRTPMPTTAKFDLDMSVCQVGDGHAVVLTYSTELYDADTITTLTERYLRVLAGAVADPGRPVSALPLLSLPEWNRLTGEWAHGPAARSPGSMAHELFARHAVLAPDAPAISAGGTRYGYGEIDARANGLAARLRAAGAGPDDVVGVLAHRGVDLFVAILGVLKADAAYLPLHPSHPDGYLTGVLAEASARHVVTEDGLDHRLAGWAGSRHAVAGPPSPPAPRRARPDHLAYVLFTSGSTGAPKGVAITHRALSNMVATMADTYRHTSADRVLQFANPGFDITVEETFPTWSAGGCVVLADEPPPPPERMAAVMTRERITFAILTSSNWARWATAAAAAGEHPGRSLRLVSIGAEPVDPAALRAWQADAGIPLYNCYGLTETTVNATGGPIAEPFTGERVPIGRPLAGVRAYVLDSARNPVPAAVAGELYLGGECLARGYLGRPELTAERFVPSPFGDGGRLHRSGDLARWRPDGTLEVLGRLDDQLKVNGYRIEPGHVEAALCAHPGVAAAVVAVRGGTAGERLVGYVVPAVPAGLREHLTARLPAYLVPSALVGIEAIPVTGNGKVDLGALPEPAAQARTGAAPSTPTERLLAGIWQEVLGTAAVGVQNNFFELGGTSLALASAHALLRAALGRAVPMVALYEHPTVSALARYLDGDPADTAPATGGRGAHLRAGRARVAARRRARD